jgi:hypothetical protein
MGNRLPPLMTVGDMWLKLPRDIKEIVKNDDELMFHKRHL